MTEKKATGFALNPAGINRGGRPLGAKNVKTRARKRAEKALYESQDKLLDTIRLYHGLMTKDEEILRTIFKIDADDVSIAMQMKAAENIQRTMEKSPELLSKLVEAEDKLKEEEEEEEEMAPVIQLQPRQA